MQRIASDRGGRCLSTDYINIITPLKWMCSAGHTWESPPHHVKNGKNWCRKCAGKEPLTIEDMDEIASDRGGRCLSTNYIDQNTHLKWMCSAGHTWEAAPHSVKYNKSWCLKCAGKEPLTIEVMQKIAADRGGKCLSINYINYSTHLKWMCSEGHSWEATPHSIKSRKSWCNICRGGVSLTIEEMHRIAADRGGKCLSTRYINSKTKLSWMCSEGHTWEAIPNKIKNEGHWCRTCSRQKQSQ